MSLFDAVDMTEKSRSSLAGNVLAQQAPNRELFWAMKTLSFPLRCALWVAALALFAPVLGTAATTELGEAAGSLPVPAGISRATVQDAIVRALLGRQWEVQSKSDERVVGYLKHRSNEATLTFIYSEAKVDLFCVGYQINKKTGVREKPEQPKGWLNFIRTDLGKILGRSAATK